uniref:Uncharacterized protein n=1 Tax=Chromera velia CCMP2878 TaxID=1169474 RepID=A0A0G4GU56_9ALVE|eukprot:Cvel_23378.t1-p1 / transcript=Cvel_23378.t1 / gene=Cvel_23378 / organism=Chromera_velia_CCMP2878 / gene_product=Serine/threonine-protein phosphatase 6 regulatory, putative / transcript_product=Serine/threonine-protein phosphatase 6 regulatory, putative / location=Cvel_scaffold2402:7366-8031(-) / protein_length=222 / sequence_SO=supercontig / SO=protein_coding / is_pseudo=false
MTALQRAICMGNVEAVQLLLFYGADVHVKESSGMTALHLAALHGHRQATELLLDCGADVNEREGNCYTPLFMTVRGFCDASGRFRLSDHWQVAELLLSRGVDMNARCKWEATVLHYAAWWGSVDVARVLVRSGIDVQARQKSGWTALHEAAVYDENMEEFRINPTRKLLVAKMLVSHGIDTKVASVSRETALTIAKKSWQRFPANQRMHDYLAGEPPLCVVQ